MDIDKTSFYPRLLDIISDISTSHFVAIDLELSGVPTKKDWSLDGQGRPSLQRRYEAIKAAAEKYHILQVGLTCVEEDVDTGKYICKPYNFELSPLIEESSLDLERDFTFHTGAVAFLKDVAFDFGKSFRVGIPYLSRAESKLAREKFDARQKRDAVADMHVKETDVEALALLQRARGQINRWLADKSRNSPTYLNIGPPGFDSSQDDFAPLPEFTRFEKRLVHQLIRAEYPSLVSIGKRGFIQVVHFDEAREARIQAERKADLNARIGKHKGFRWVIDALLGRDISRLDVKLCARDPMTGEAIVADVDGYRGRLNDACYVMRDRPRVLVGHNCFLDLVYLYHTFLGDLPDDVGEFARLLHKRWPTVIDTKYMATHNCGDISPTSSLEEIATQLAPSTEQEVFDVLSDAHPKYKDTQFFHEAGFDSLLTAQVAIRLSTLLEIEGTYTDEADEVDEAGGVSVPNTGTSKGLVSTAVDTGRNVLQAAMSNLGLESSSNSKARAPANNQSTTNLLEEGGFTPSDPYAEWKIESPPPRYKPSEAEARGIEGGMPRFEGDFWRVYGNRLRVFGTEESVLSLERNM